MSSRLTTRYARFAYPLRSQFVRLLKRKAPPICAQGRFVLQDNNFRWIRKASRNDPSQLKVEDFLIFPAGIVCGAMNRLGVDCTVSADATSTPMCIFTVEIVQQPSNARQ
mmetsp:Transcript_29422/g.113904  ORF Transcript_29422/g.113904 Transcript_29422/m.113904 type:complete len:110 (-) Transcript_29422:334-663(-)